jgi:hypothetical protein
MVKTGGVQHRSEIRHEIAVLRSNFGFWKTLRYEYELRHHGNFTCKMQVEPMLLATGDWLYARVDNILGESENVNVIQRSYGGTQRRSYQVARFREGLSYP